mmetsp:Transcript_14578/g.35564  ORF Transcript_14578/g.35564 Transcript_14578/m.35564 type:complete len:199 (+) Transcript_14578:102-698(+)
MSVLFEHVDDMRALSKVDGKGLERCCEICIRQFQNPETDKKMILRTAKELGLSSGELSAAVDELSQFFLACCKKQLNQSNFNILAKTMKLEKERAAILYKFYVANLDSMRSILSTSSKRLPHYNNLNWRLELEMSSRTLHHKVKPSFLLELTTKDETGEKAELMQCDYSVMKHVCDQLEVALKDLNSSHCRRMSTYIN